MRTGDVVTVTIGARRDYLTLDDAVTYDPTIGQHDEGFWAHGATDEDSYFVSSHDASVWEWEPRTHAHTLLVGTVEYVSTPKDEA